MRDYGKISPKFWIGKSGKAMRGDMEAQIVALYLMTCPTSDMTGVFHCPLMYIAHETGLGLEGATKGLTSLIGFDFCTIDEDTDMVFVHEMAKFQIGEELKVNDNQVKGVKKAYLSMTGKIKEAFFARYKDAFHLLDRSPSEAPPKPRTGTRAEAGERTGTSSAPKGAGGEPPIGIDADLKTPEQLTKDELWIAGKSILQQQGMPKDQCGSFVGKLVKDYGPEIVVEAVRAAVVERPADAISFLKASCMARKQEGGKSLIPWHATDDGVAAKGLSLVPQIKSLPGESAFAFKARVILAIENGGVAPIPVTAPMTVIKDMPKASKPAGIPSLKSLVKNREVV